MNITPIELTNSGENEQVLECPIHKCRKNWYWLVDSECIGELEPCRNQQGARGLPLA